MGCEGMATTAALLPRPLILIGEMSHPEAKKKHRGNFEKPNSCVLSHAQRGMMDADITGGDRT